MPLGHIGHILENVNHGVAGEPAWPLGIRSPICFEFRKSSGHDRISSDSSSFARIVASDLRSHDSVSVFQGNCTTLQGSLARCAPGCPRLQVKWPIHQYDPRKIASRVSIDKSGDVLNSLRPPDENRASHTQEVEQRMQIVRACFRCVAFCCYRGFTL